MTEPLVIVGAGGHARETAFAFLLGASADRFLGFVDDNVATATPEGWPVLGSIDAAASYLKASFVVAINDPRTRRSVVERLHQLGVSRWGSVIHPEIRLHESVHMGNGCSVLGGCQVTVKVRVGDHCILNRGSQLSHDCEVGDFCSLNPGACVAGNVRIGSGSEVGSASVLRQGTSVGQGCTVGMGAVVVSDVPDNAVVAGNPARLLRSALPW